jgi:hypothetical protein
VLGIRYTPKISKRNNYYMQVLYFIGGTSIKESVMFDSVNAVMKRNLKIWWTHRGGKLPIPEGTDEAVERAGNELKVPSIIRVITNRPYKEVIGCDFEEELEIWNQEKCTCHQGKPPCGYCESGNYIPF